MLQPITLLIKYAEGSLYWREYFDSIEACNHWLDEEKTRPYWKKDFVIEIDDNTVALKEAERLSKEAFQQALALRKQKLDAIKALKDKPAKSAKDIEDLLVLLAENVF